MVKFGERLIQQRIPGWEAMYIDYEALKEIVDALEGSAPKETTSAEFAAALKTQVAKADAHVSEYAASLRAEFEAATAKAKPKKTELAEIEQKMSALRRFVGTNVIAATKIVKKHDKHVPVGLQKRTVVGDLIRGAAGISDLPSLHESITKAIVSSGGNTQLVAVQMEHVPLGFTSPDDDDETDSKLRSLPNWLLQGAAADEGKVPGTRRKSKEERETTYFDTFFSTYLSDWRFEEDEHSLLHNKATKIVVGGGEDDGWNVQFEDDSINWSDMTQGGKAIAVCVNLFKVCVILFALYSFICSLSFLANGFRLVAGKQAGDIFRESEIFNNPLAGMLVGVLVTVLVQSSSTSTSIVITMVAADLFTVKQAISLVMGANIGTSVTSTIVALAQSAQRDEFRRAFAAATVHDMFNFLTVAVLLPIEAATGYLFALSKALIDASPGLKSGSKPPDILKALTKPLTSSVMSLDKKLMAKIASAVTDEERAALNDKHMLKKLFGCEPAEGCDLSDAAAGALVLVGALLILCLTLFLIVYTLKSMLKGRVAVWLHKSVNGQVPDVKVGGCTVYMGWLSGYLAMATGLLVTICVQSSSITTSALTPLVGLGVIKVETMYPTVLGANIGTCITGILAALAASADKLEVTLQVAYAHLLFNISGILIWYACWPLRAVPIAAAKFLGNTTATYKWFALAYLFVAFFVMPSIFMGLSLAAEGAAIAFAAVLVTIGLFVLLVNTLQQRKPGLLPPALRTWLWLPKWMRSLEPMDRVVCAPASRALFSACPCCKKGRAPTGGQSETRDLEIAANRM